MVIESEHAHNNISHEMGGEPRVTSHQQKYELALAATKLIPNATGIVHQHFKRGKQNFPFQLKVPKVYNQKMHHFPVRY